MRERLKENMPIIICPKFWILFAVLAGVLLVVRGQPPGDTLDPSKPLVGGETLISARGIFELGFFKPSNSSKIFLGIWYKNIPDPPVVWVANNDNPMNGSTGVLNLTVDGDLLLLDKTANIVWSTGKSNAINPLLQLLDSGNLILTESGSEKKMLWQSFDHPSHTFLPGMKIGVDFRTNLSRYLISWKSSFDPSPGDYTYGMNPNGVPEAFIWKGSSHDRIFRTGPWDGIALSGRPDMATNGILKFEFLSNINETYYTFQPFDRSVLARAVLNESGVVQRLVWSNTSNGWIQYWIVPSDPCDQYAKCGGNGICTTSYSTMCQCLQGFIPKSPTNWNLRVNAEGCDRRRPLNCSSDRFLQLQNVKLPDTSNASAASNMTLDECQSLCLKNCSCTAFSIIIQNMCLTWTGSLVDIREFIQGGDDLYIRLAASELSDTVRRNSRKNIYFGIMGILVVLLLFFVGSLLWLIKRRKNSEGGSLRNSTFSREENELELQLFDMLTIRAATSNFSKDNVVGIGGFGPVYKGQLADGNEVAVKKLSKNSSQGIDEFKTEAVLIAKLQHRNLVRLLGCCIEDGERMLIYEYMQNKSLNNFIFDKRKSALLDWKKRFDIIIGIARGLLYLHQDSRLKIIHRDLKTSNILLDNDMNPKISDFGLARIFSVGQTEGSTKKVVGTCGYMSPEYAMGGVFSEKSDVYSFGVILLEILSGKRNSMVLEVDQSINLLGHAWKLWKECRSLELLTESIGSSYPIFEVLRCIQVGLLCVQEGSEDRPTMVEVVLMLSSDTIMLAQPNRPGFCVARSFAEGTSSNDLTITTMEGR